MPGREVFAQRCRQVCEAQRWELLPTGILVRWGDGRQQLVALEFFEFEREELVRLSTTIGQVGVLSREQLVSALEANAELAHGALSIRHDELCMTDTLMIAVSGVAEIEAAIAYLARAADDYERIVYRTDAH